MEEVVGEFVALKRKGPRFLGLCPFHNEKTPASTSVPTSASTNASVAGKLGTASASSPKHEHLSYVESIRWLGKRYNIDLPEEAKSRTKNSNRANAKASPWCSNGRSIGAWSICGPPMKASASR
ncbi:MAG: hypothetical protein IPF64_05025 [Flavobacteriales bacterium]|nr:hypothetical protein [Flavobacteriales bacterium]